MRGRFFKEENAPYYKLEALAEDALDSLLPFGDASKCLALLNYRPTRPGTEIAKLKELHREEVKVIVEALWPYIKKPTNTVITSKSKTQIRNASYSLYHMLIILRVSVVLRLSELVENKRAKHYSLGQYSQYTCLLSQFNQHVFALEVALRKTLNKLGVFPAELLSRKRVDLVSEYLSIVSGYTLNKAAEYLMQEFRAVRGVTLREKIVALKAQLVPRYTKHFTLHSARRPRPAAASARGISAARPAECSPSAGVPPTTAEDERAALAAAVATSRTTMRR